MKISTSAGNLFKHFGIKSGMSILANAGFEAIDYGICEFPWNHALFQDAPLTEAAAYYKQIARLAKEHNLEISQSHATFPLKVFNDETDSGLLRCGIRQIYAAAYMNCPYIVFHPVLHPDFDNGQNLSAAKQINLDFFSAMAPALQGTGITLCIENMFRGENGMPKIFNAGSDAEQLIDWIDTLNSMHGAHFAACLDTGHATVVGQDPAAMLRELGERTRVLHIHDNDGILDQHWLPGEGIIDWNEVLQALKEIGYTGTFNTEASIFFNKCTELDVSDTASATNLCKELYSLSRSLADQIH